MNKLNISGIPTATKVRIVVYFLVVLNQIAVSAFDFQIIPFGEEQLNEIVTSVVTAITLVVAAYKDTPVTTAGQIGHETTKELKKDNISKDDALKDNTHIEGGE